MKKNTLKGITSKQLLDMPYDIFNKLSKPELRLIVNRLAGVANKRVKTLNKHNYKAVTRSIMESGGKFTTRGKDINKLRAEYIRVKQFLQSKTSTVRGINKVQAETIKTLKSKGINITKEDFNKFWETYERIKERDPRVAERALKYTALQDVAEMINDGYSMDDIIDHMTKDLTAIYERGVNDGFTSVSDFFELPPDF